MFTKGSRSVLFVHVPKTGGTSLEDMLGDAGWTRSLYTGSRDPGFGLLTCSPQHYHAALLYSTVRVEALDAVFTVVRDPVARFRSEYAMHVRDPHAGHAEQVEAWAEQALAAYAKDPFHLDNHLRPQVEFAMSEGDIYRFEEGIPAIARDLDERLALGVPHPDLHKLSSDDGGLRSDDVEISDHLAERLHEVYADDFRLLGYGADPC